MSRTARLHWPRGMGVGFLRRSIGRIVCGSAVGSNTRIVRSRLAISERSSTMRFLCGNQLARQFGAFGAQGGNDM
jgi:hypothetical protein